MLSVKDLQLGYSDALNYTQRQNKNMFNEVFVRNTFLDELTKQSSFFLIGEKGTEVKIAGVYGHYVYVICGAQVGWVNEEDINY